MVPPSSSSGNSRFHGVKAFASFALRVFSCSPSESSGMQKAPNIWKLSGIMTSCQHTGEVTSWSSHAGKEGEKFMLRFCNDVKAETSKHQVVSIWTLFWAQNKQIMNMSRKLEGKRLRVTWTALRREAVNEGFCKFSSFIWWGQIQQPTVDKLHTNRPVIGS